VHLSQEAVREAVYGAVADINESLPEERRIPLTGTTDIFGRVDSLGALNLLLRIEQRLGDLAGAPMDLIEEGLYENTVFRRPALDELVEAVAAALAGAPR
jgi:hypothetical protein